MRECNGLEDTLSISLHCENGSISSIHYFANGSKRVRKEYVEVYQSGVTLFLNDFREVSVFGSGLLMRKRMLSQDKGQ